MSRVASSSYRGFSVVGKKQSGLALNDVVLPAWSKNDPREFIRIHRMVSSLPSDELNQSDARLGPGK